MKQYSWFEIYRVALLELDRNKVPERIAVARKTLTARLEEISSSSNSERHAIEDALNVLYAVEQSEASRRAQAM